MSEPKWTEGPWLVAGDRMAYALEDFRDSRGRRGQRNRVTIQVDGGPETPKEEVSAVVNLIAAAPELYEALFNVLDSIGALSSPHDLYGYAMSESEIDKVFAALAKARGETAD